MIDHAYDFSQDWIAMPQQPISSRKRSTLSATAAQAQGQSASQPDTAYAPPLTITHAELLNEGSDTGFRAVVYLMNTVLSRLQVCREAFGKTLHLTGSQFAVLFGVAHQQHGAGVSIRELATHLSIAQSHVTTEVSRMVSMGLLQKNRHDKDRRSVLISLTTMGQKYVDRVSPLVQRVNDRLFANISAEDFSIVGKTLHQIALNSELAIAELRMHKLKRATHV